MQSNVMGDGLHVRMESDAFGAGALEIAELTGREQISQLFELDLLVVTADPDGLELDDVVGAEATLVFERNGGEIRRIHGIVASARDRLDVEAKHASYRLVFAPRFFRMTLVETLDVFLDLGLPDLLRHKLDGAGFKEGDDYELRLMEQYPPREFVVQYKETDVAFVSRVCEHLGVSFFFEHRSGRDVLVFTDDNSGFHDVPGLGSAAFRGRGERRDVFRLEESVRMIPAQYYVRDYNYRTPQVDLTGHAKVESGTGGVVEYGTHVKTPEEAEKMAHVRAQERLAMKHVFEGSSDIAAFGAGAKVKLLDHPRGDLTLLLTRIEHRYTSPTLLGGAAPEQLYSNEFCAIREKRRFRPPRVTPKPRIHGVITGVIDGSGSDEYAELDDQGRYRVRFLFDTTNPGEGQASRLIRMAQPHSGPGYGMHFPLRKGVEVLLTFIDGDPDRPIIAATVPNPQTASPVHSGNAPRNVIRTGGGNEINIDDTKDAQRIKLTTPRMSTTFQLGHHNSPEDGAMLETWGASSNVAMAGMATFSSANAAVHALGEFLEAGNISRVAKPPTFVAAATNVSEIIQSVAEAGAAACEIGLNALKAVALAKKKDAIHDQVEAKKKFEALEKEREANEEKVDALLEETSHEEPLPDDASDDEKKERLLDDQLHEKVAAYQAKLAQYQQDQAKYLADSEKLADLKRGEKDGSETAQIAQWEAVVDADKEKTEESQKELEEAQDELNEAMKKAAHPELVDAEGEVADEEAFAAADYGKYSDTKTALDDQTKNEDDYADASIDADEQRTKAFEAAEDAEIGDDAVRLETAKKVFEAAKMGGALFSLVLLTYATVKQLIHTIHEKLHEEELKVATKATKRRKHVKAFPTLAGFKEKRRHTLGSTGSTEIYGKKTLFGHAEKVVLEGKEDATLVAKKHMAVLSKKSLEVAAPKDLKLTSKSGPIDMASKRLKAVADEQISIESKKGNVFLEATKGQLQLRSKAPAFLESTNHQVQIHAKKEAFLESVDSSISITAKSAAGLESTDADVTIKAKKDLYVEASDGGMNVSAKGMLMLESGSKEIYVMGKQRVTVGAPQIKLNGVVDVGGVLLVKGQKVAKKGKKAPVQQVDEERPSKDDSH